MSNDIIPNNISDNPESEIQPFKVFVRIRPFNEKEKQGNTTSLKASNKQVQAIPKTILVAEDNIIFVLDPSSADLNGRRERSFVYDNIFTDKHSNIHIFDGAIKSMVDNILQGYNSTALAYGVTGTGKSHTMFGSKEYLAEGGYDTNNLVNLEKGICFYALDYLFNQIDRLSRERTFQVKISYLEIYNEHIMDLLSAKPKSLIIVEDSIKGVVVPDLTEFTVTNTIDMMKLVIEGNSKRTMAATNQNQFSSRSHAVIQVVVDQKNKVRDTKEEYLISKFLIVDLAGSERGGLEKGARTQEGANINKSLLSLGNCINILSDKSKKGAFVPYRDSKLTRLLKDSLGGNIQTVMIACVSPSHLSYDETINTLNYATRARIIQKKITKNIREIDVHISQYKEIIDSLKTEIDQLKSIIQNQQSIINQKELISARKTLPDDMHINKKFKNDSKQEKLKNDSNFFSKSSNGLLSHRNGSSNNRSNPANKVSQSTVINNKNQNYAINNLKLVRNHSSAIKPTNQINLDIYKKYLENAAHNLNESINDNSISLEGNLIEFEVLEQQVENLNTDKITLEELIEKSHIYDRDVEEKYEIIKSFHEKYLELINDKLIENIEQNMILKFNMKEIIELNTTNNQHLNILFGQLSNLENLKFSRNLEDSYMQEGIVKLYEEIKSIKKAMLENEKIKERICESLNRNLEIKAILKKILMKLISNKKEKKDITAHQKYDLAFQSLLREKELLENKNKNFQQNLSILLIEKSQKNSQLNLVENELEKLRGILAEKDNKIHEMEKNMNKLFRSISSKEISEEENQKSDNELYTSHKKNKIEDQSIYNNTEIEKVEINLQDDYFTPELETNRKSFDNSEKKQIENSEALKRQSDSNFNSCQSIKYIINQTNNIVNNNINKIIKNDQEKQKPGNHLVRNNSVNNPNSKLENRVNYFNNFKNEQMRDSYSNLNRNSQSKSNRLVKKNPGKVYEVYLDEMHSEKQTENLQLDTNKQRANTKTKKPFANKSYKDLHAIRNYNKSNNKINVDTNQKKITELEIKKRIQNKIMNHSLSISYVSVKDENDFNSELDIMEGIKDNKENGTSKSNYANKIKKENSITPRNNAADVKNQMHNLHTIVHDSDPVKDTQSKSNTRSSMVHNKNINVHKFLNCNKDAKVSHHSQNFLNHFPKEKPVQLHKKDHSPSPINLLKQARLEKQLKNQNEDLVKPNDEASSYVDAKNESCDKNGRNSKKLTRNSIEFLADYENNKNRINTDSNEKSEEIVVNNQTGMNKSDIAESVIKSVIDLDLIIQSNEEVEENFNFCSIDFNNKIKLVSEVEDKENSKTDLLKCLNNVIRNPRITKFLDKK